MTVRRLREEIGDTTELAGWMAYLELEPPHQEHWHMAAMVALNARKIAGDRRAKLKDFLPQKPSAPQTPEELRDKLKALFGKGGS